MDINKLAAPETNGAVNHAFYYGYIMTQLMIQ
jgi:hypothetical protein